MHPFFELSPGTIKVKICGVTNQRDAEAAIAAGADALGFNVYAQSKRRVRLDAVAPWLTRLPARICRVIVSVNCSVVENAAILQHDAVDALQLHGNESSAECQALQASGKPLIKAFPALGPEVARATQDFPVNLILLDNFDPEQFGGTGRPFAWQNFAGLAYGRPIILSGGLTPENVAAAVQLFRPAAVDVASGVEQAPGSKDAGKMAEFIAAAKEAARTVAYEKV